MAITSVSEFVELLRQHSLLEPTQLDAVQADLQAQFPEPRALARDLMQRGWLTPFQVSKLAQGEAPDLAMGPYVLLDEIGQGAMGQVFKARHLKQGHIVALKVVRKDQKSNPKVLSRFRREIQAITRLSHPNVVTACDIDEVDRAGFFAMEFVEGVNLHDLIRQGPMPLASAIDYVRQAATGLQHAYEKGLIHRDIKPGNLLITAPATKPGPDQRAGRWGVLKILDLGLVLLRQREGRKKRGDSLTHLTGEGLMLGTVDYVAPEQVMSPSEVDIRADLYSLGCTFYEMLTGHVPFPNGSPGKKLYCHQEVPPLSVEQFRPGLPREIPVVVSKLMAKAPNDRFQTPAHLASTLTTILGGLDSRAIDWHWTPPMGEAPPFAIPLSQLATATRRRWLPIAVGVGLVVLIAALVGVWLIFGRSNTS